MKKAWRRGVPALLALALVVIAFIALGGPSPQPGAQPTSTPSAESNDPNPTPTRPSHDERPSDDPTDVYSDASIREGRRTARTWGDIIEGTIAGIHLDPDYERGNCEDWVEMKRSDLKRYMIGVPEDLPDGWTVEPPTGWLCAGERPLSVGRQISYGHGIGFGYARLYDERSLNVFAGEKVVGEGSIQGHQAVFVRPRSSQGLGNSWIAWIDGADVIVFMGKDVRFSVMRRAAESLPL